LCGLLTIAAMWWLARTVEVTTVNRDWPNYSMTTAWTAAACLGLIVFSRAASFDIVITMTATWALALFLSAELTQHRQKQNWLLIGFYCLVGLSLLAKVWLGLSFRLASLARTTSCGVNCQEEESG
jgi:4-amino-4-deoxy-L-arabinose transferase-like glycosyltransferase